MLHAILATLVLIAASNAMLYDRLSTTPDEPLQRKRRIVGGYATTIQEAPYIVSIRKHGLFKCGGTLLTPHCLVTAAHCVGGKEQNRQQFTVHAGNTYLRDQRYRRRILQIFVAPNYNNKTLDHDVAIMKLHAAVPLRKGQVETIALASETPIAKQVVQIAGWGYMSDEIDRPALQLRSAFVHVIERDVCRSLYANYRNLTEHMFCASIPGIVDTCFADSGGPAVTNGQLVGIVSWGRGQHCAEINAPGVYANVATLRPWIEQVISTHC